MRAPHHQRPSRRRTLAWACASGLLALLPALGLQAQDAGRPWLDTSRSFETAPRRWSRG